MKHRNKRGFTLIEMLVVIAVIAALSVAIGVSSSQMMASSTENNYEETYKEIIKNAKIYVEIDNNHKLTNNTSTSFTLNDLIVKGLQDEKILKTQNPALAADMNFNTAMPIKVQMSSNGQKTVYITAGTCTISSDKSSSNYVEKIEWGTC